ncbi:SDR family NAD(P)-dependent oxidoreductase [Hominifimenecus sp. rT4P-3]|uniref:SDR family NAD(P)-dependent oxidoreductase n=1 Tax=Hominifimenecus sp. rT4P-3 TaxID=3242979 RepID=UPI003DA50A0C
MRRMNRFEGKTVLMTGGGDMGLAAAERLLEEGANLVLADYSQEVLDACTKTLKERNAEISRMRTVVCDVRQMEDCQKTAKYAKEQFGRIDVLVTTAGILKHSLVDEMPEEDWKNVLDINLTGTFHSVKAAVPVMKEQKYGRIVLISSLGGRKGRPGVAVNYAASKAGVVGLTMALAEELGAWNITVNSIAPGPLRGKLAESQAPETRARLNAGIPLGRIGEVEEIASAIAFLASDESAWTTGEVLDINGGLQY